MRSVAPIHPVADPVPLSRFQLHDLESVRLVLRGSSVVDWVRLNFSDPSEIDAFIRVNELDPDDPVDRARLAALQARAIGYLKDHLRHKVPDAIREATDLRTLLRFASQTRGRRSDRFHACMTLKVMHIIHHADAHELLSKLPISDAEVAVLIQAKIERAVRGLRERGFPIAHFSGNRKTRYSVWSKLLAKKSTQSAQVLDKLRFRIIVERAEEIPALLLALTRELLPFNYIVPGETHNSLVDLLRQLRRSGNVLSYKDEPVMSNEPVVTDLVEEQRNEFSGPDYRVLNFVVDVPLRIDRVLSLEDPAYRELGGVVFGGVEFQIVDHVTAHKNESGANRHVLYKARQRQKVKQRLEAGRRSRAQGDDKGEG